MFFIRVFSFFYVFRYKNAETNVCIQYFYVKMNYLLFCTKWNYAKCSFNNKPNSRVMDDIFYTLVVYIFICRMIQTKTFIIILEQMVFFCPIVNLLKIYSTWIMPMFQYNSVKWNLAQQMQNVLLFKTKRIEKIKVLLRTNVSCQIKHVLNFRTHICFVYIVVRRCFSWTKSSSNP